MWLKKKKKRPLSCWDSSAVKKVQRDEDFSHQRLNSDFAGHDPSFPFLSHYSTIILYYIERVFLNITNMHQQASEGHAQCLLFSLLSYC